MITLSPEDLQALQNGTPPPSDELIQYLLVDSPWLNTIKEYCLDALVANGGSKVKILYGHPATGKSHYLQAIRIHAENTAFFTIYLNLMETEFYLNDFISLYKAIAAKVDIDVLAESLRTRILQLLGYSVSDFVAFSGSLTNFLCEQEKASPTDAKRYLREAIHSVVNSMEVDFSFRKFLSIFMEAVVEGDTESQTLASQWLRGNKIERIGKVQSSLYETLNRSNARIWLYSLGEVIKLCGYKGVVILIDQFEAILPNSGVKMRYTAMRRNDVFEMLRQLIDDLDFFRNILVLIAGNTEILTNERFGLQSYHALWMRIQPGFSQNDAMNPYADLVDANKILQTVAESGDLQMLRTKIDELSQYLSESETGTMPFWTESFANFRDIVQENMMRYTVKGVNHE